MSINISQINNKITNLKEIYKLFDIMNKELIGDALEQRVSSIISNFSIDNTINNYISAISSIHNTVMDTAKKAILDMIKKIDDDFFNSDYRKRHYVVHSFKSRTIVTIFGEITFKRRYYINKNDNSRYFYVDRKLGFNKYDVYDPCIKSLVIEYSATNSASEVSKVISDICSFSLSNSNEGKIILSRQTIKNIIDNAPNISVVEKRFNKTPKELHISLDEKWVHLQGKSRDNKHTSHEVKTAIIYDNATYQNHSRMVLNNVHYITSTNGVTTLRERIMDYLYQAYDLDKVEHIYIQGDGANWIQLTPRELTFNENTTITYLIDWFHVVKGMNKITGDSKYVNRLFQHLYGNDKDKFIRVLDTLKKTYPNRVSKIDDNASYILNNWEHIMKRINKLNKKCSMESHISHGIAAHFTEVPKAYSSDSLSQRINQRELFLNKHCLRALYLKAYDFTGQEITLGEKETMGVYEDNIFDDLYSEYLSQSKQNITNFISRKISNDALELSII